MSRDADLKRRVDARLRRLGVAPVDQPERVSKEERALARLARLGFDVEAIQAGDTKAQLGRRTG